MTTFTKVLINPQRRQGGRLLTDPQAMHAAVRAAFPPDLDESEERILWRVDTRGYEHTLYIVGPEKSNAEHIVEQAGWDTRPPQVVEYGRFLDKLTMGQQWTFELLANPTYSEPTEPGKRGKVKAHVSPRYQLEWLKQKSAGAGFTLLDGDLAPNIVERKTLHFRKGKPGENTPGRRRQSVSIATARFRGVLEVTDTRLLQQTLIRGIGRARGYGCGLLTLAPYRSFDND